MAARVHTVCGPIGPEKLGFTHTHEHIVCDGRMTHRTEPPTRGGYMLLDDQARAVTELKKFKELGGGSMVELTTASWGRDVRVLRDISKASGVNIIATTGFYTWPYIPKELDTRSIPDLANDLILELTEGADGADTTAGILKSAIHFDRIYGIEEKCLRAVARASISTGAAITTHTNGKRHQEIPGGNVGMQHVNILRDEGVSANRLVVGHTDEQADINFLSELAALGCYVQFDVIKKTHFMLDVTRAKLIKELINRGYIENLLLGTDRCRHTELYDEKGGVGYTYILDTFLDMLKTEGVTRQEIEQICCINPGQMLAYG